MNPGLRLRRLWQESPPKPLPQAKFRYHLSATPWTRRSKVGGGQVKYKGRCGRVNAGKRRALMLASASASASLALTAANYAPYPRLDIQPHARTPDPRRTQHHTSRCAQPSPCDQAGSFSHATSHPLTALRRSSSPMICTYHPACRRRSTRKPNPRQPSSSCTGCSGRSRTTGA